MRREVPARFGRESGFPAYLMTWTCRSQNCGCSSPVHQSQKYQLEDRLIQYFPREIAATRVAIMGCEADVATRDAHPAPADSFAGIELQGLHYDERVAAGEALMQILPTIMDTDPVHIGSFSGFDVEVSLEQFGKHVLTLKGRLEHHVELARMRGAT